jgi:transposase
MLVVLRVGEQRYRAVWEVLDGASVTEVARRFGVSRQSVHVWLRRFAAWIVHFACRLFQTGGR